MAEPSDAPAETADAPEPAEGESTSDTKDEMSYWKEMARKNEKAAKAAASALDKARTAQMSEQERAVEAAKREGRAEAVTIANARILKAEVKAAAAGKLADPADAVQFLDLGDFAVSDDGDVDTKAISKAIDSLIVAKPYLGANAPKQTAVPAGARGSETLGGDDMNSRIRRAAGRG